MARKTNARELILEALPGTQAQIAAKTGISKNNVSRWLVILKDNDLVHISEVFFEKTKGVPVSIYSVGSCVGVEIKYGERPVRKSQTNSLPKRFRRMVEDDLKPEYFEFKIPEPHYLMALYNQPETEHG